MAILLETVIENRALTTKNVDYLLNRHLQLRRGENMCSGTAEGVELVELNVDECSYDAVEVDSFQDPADCIDAAIQSLVVVRNELRMREAAACAPRPSEILAAYEAPDESRKQELLDYLEGFLEAQRSERRAAFARGAWVVQAGRRHPW